MLDKARVHLLPNVNVSWIRRKYLNVPYANLSEFEKMDIYLPDKGQGPFPTIVFIHGGAWYACDKADTQVKPFLTLLNQGYAVVSLNYRLTGEAGFPAGVKDCKAAIRYLKAHAAEYSLNPKRMALAGQSAGAYYVLMLITTVGNPELEDLSMGGEEQDTTVQCAVSWYAATDIYEMYNQMQENGYGGYSHSDANSPEARYLGGKLENLSKKWIQMASPIHHIHAGISPVLLQHGLNDGMVPHQQTVSFYEKAKEIAGEDRVTLELFPDAGHADAAFETPKNMKLIRQFFDRYLK